MATATRLVYGGETYSVSIRGTPADGFLITNRRQGGTPGAKRLSVSVEKRWDPARRRRSPPIL